MSIWSFLPFCQKATKGIYNVNMEFLTFLSKGNKVVQVYQVPFLLLPITRDPER